MSKLKDLLNGKQIILVPPEWAVRDSMYNAIEKVAGFREAEKFLKSVPKKRGRKPKKAYKEI